MTMMSPLTDAVKQYVSAAQVCRIATVRATGEPHVIPVCPVFDGDRTLYVDLGERSASALAIEHEPRVTVLIDEYHDDWSRLRKVLLRCQATRVTGADQDAAWVMIRQKFPQYATVNWKPRLTLALRIVGWLQEGIGS
jgi:nitroimidazol reductase NimA-like FMN-containing flavoprotein (pyridoxamine 5'-phosphate oxidase superfamily)